MTRENFERALANFLRRRPFQPFTLELVSGSRLEINHPEALRQTEDLFVYRSTSGLYNVFAYDSVVRFIDATGVS